MRLTRHDYTALEAMVAEPDLPYTRMGRTTRDKLSDNGLADHEDGYYNITEKGKQLLAVRRGAPEGHEFSKTDAFRVTNDQAMRVLLADLRAQGRIRFTAIRPGVWMIKAC